MITQEDLKYHLDYEKETGKFTRRIRSARRNTVGEEPGFVMRIGYRIIGIKGRQYYAHRLAWLYVHGKWPENQIDHINGDKLDNRICNLRNATDALNRKNMKMPCTNKSGVAGVSWHKKAGCWRSHIKINYRQISLGLHKNFFEAVCARKSAEIKYGFHENHGRVVK